MFFIGDLYRGSATGRDSHCTGRDKRHSKNKRRNFEPTTASERGSRHRNVATRPSDAANLNGRRRPSTIKSADLRPAHSHWRELVAHRQASSGSTTIINLGASVNCTLHPRPHCLQKWTSQTDGRILLLPQTSPDSDALRQTVGSGGRPLLWLVCTAATGRPRYVGPCYTQPVS